MLVGRFCLVGEVLEEEDLVAVVGLVVFVVVVVVVVGLVSSTGCGSGASSGCWTADSLDFFCAATASSTSIGMGSL